MHICIRFNIRLLHLRRNNSNKLNKRSSKLSKLNRPNSKLSNNNKRNKRSNSSSNRRAFSVRHRHRQLGLLRHPVAASIPVRSRSTGILTGIRILLTDILPFMVIRVIRAMLFLYITNTCRQGSLGRWECSHSLMHTVNCQVFRRCKDHLRQVHIAVSKGHGTHELNVTSAPVPLVKEQW
jgi:hypothetical protein